MFWNREEKIIQSHIGPMFSIPVPAKKEFRTMLEILKDAEKFDSKNEKEVCEDTLKTLVKFVNSYIEKNISK